MKGFWPGHKKSRKRLNFRPVDAIIFEFERKLTVCGRTQSPLSPDFLTYFPAFFGTVRKKMKKNRNSAISLLSLYMESKLTENSGDLLNECKN